MQTGSTSTIGRANMQVLCPACRHAMWFPQNARGKRTKCSKCSYLFVLPDRDSPAKNLTNTKEGGKP